jgi:hypothetical protein
MPIDAYSNSRCRTTSLNTAQVARFHDAMTECGKRDEQRTRKSRERRICAFDEDPTATGGRSCAREVKPAR